MGDILKEAIADAKAVRETALENAKMALEEAFTPQIKSMLSAKLKEDEIEESRYFWIVPWILTLKNGSILCAVVT